MTTWNVQGLKSPQKRSKILRHLKWLKTNVALLQESHLTECDFHGLRKRWVGEIAKSVAKGKKGGTIILIHKRLSYVITDTDANTKWRRVTITLAPKDKQAPNRTIVITNVYTPNSLTKGYFQQMTDWFFSIPPGDHIIGGVMNSGAYDIEDRKHTLQRRMAIGLSKKDTRPKEKALPEFMTNTHLIDSWRCTHPLEREYTHFSQPSQTVTRLDYILATSSTLSKIGRTEIKEISTTPYPTYLGISLVPIK